MGFFIVEREDYECLREALNLLRQNMEKHAISPLGFMVDYDKAQKKALKEIFPRKCSGDGVAVSWHAWWSLHIALLCCRNHCHAVRLSSQAGVAAVCADTRAGTPSV